MSLEMITEGNCMKTFGYIGTPKEWNKIGVIYIPYLDF